MMATTEQRAHRPASSVDYVVDEKASPIDLPDDSRIRPADEHEATIGNTGPTNWWRRGLIALGIVAAILLFLQLLGGWPGTDVQPNTPVADVEPASPE